MIIEKNMAKRILKTEEDKWCNICGESIKGKSVFIWEHGYLCKKHYEEVEKKSKLRKGTLV